MYKCMMISAAILVAITVGGTPAIADSIALQNATATFSQTSWAVSGAIDGSNTSGWAVGYSTGSVWNADAQTAAFETTTNAGYVGGTLLSFTLTFGRPAVGFEENLGRFALAVTTAARSSFADGLANGGNVGNDSIWTVLTPSTAVSALGTTLTINADHSVLASGANPGFETYTVAAQTTLTAITGIRLQALEDSTLPHNGPGRTATDGNFILTTFAVTQTAVPEPGTSVLLSSALIGLLAYAWRKRK
jgi:hypothetical protein